MSFAVQRLNDDGRTSLVAHFLALPPKDRLLRFGSALAPTIIAAYVDGIDFGRDAVFGVRDDRRDLVAAAHVAIEDDRAEVALSVFPTHRGYGIGSALFEHAATHARHRGIAELFMHCRSGNAPIMHIAQRFGMDIFVSRGDVDAYLKLQPPSAVALAIRNDGPAPSRRIQEETLR